LAGGGSLVQEGEATIARGLAMDDLPLASEFPAATREQWLKLVDGVLKGADFERRLVSRTYDGLKIEPLYPKAEDAPRAARATPGRWRVAQRVDHPAPAEANALALTELEGGADGLVLVTRKAPSARGFGLAIDTLDDLDRVLQGVMLDLVHIRLDAGGRGRQMAALLVALAERRGHRLCDLLLDLGLDPIGAMSATGVLSASWEVVAQRCGETLRDLSGRGLSGGVFLADGRPAHEAGASEAQELAFVLSSGVAYLRALEAGGHPLEAARSALSFLLIADADEFLTIAKIRALRRLWAGVEQACGVAPRPIRIRAETAWRMTTRRDPWVNLLRATLATFSAGIGGADVVTVLPFTRRLRATGRTQHAAYSFGGIQPLARRRSRGRGRRIRGPDRRTLPKGLDPVSGDRTGGRNRREPRPRGPADANRRRADGAGARRRDTQGPDYRGERIPPSPRGTRERADPLPWRAEY
jgi:methylmalonyl-CoA mutase